MKYKDALNQSMEELARNEKTIFIGYNINFGSKAYGTLQDIPEEQKIETPVAENLMLGMATGMALEGFLPVVFFERHDFMLNSFDVLLNHLDKLKEMSHNQFVPKIIIRATVGSNFPLDPGIQHKQDFSEFFKEKLSFPVFEPKTSKEVLECYKEIEKINTPVMLIERKELYECED